MKDFYPTVLGSATAGLISRVLCHPIDTIKSRLQAGQPAFRSTESFRALYRGVGAVVLGGVPGVCIYMTSYEVISHLGIVCNHCYGSI
jgi:solute carrier family 25 citrate transporter 1